MDSQRSETTTGEPATGTTSDSISIPQVFSPLLSFVTSVFNIIFTKLKVLVLFGGGGIIVGAIIGLPLGPGMALTAAAGGIIGLGIGGWWEYRRLQSEITYDELLDK